MGQAQQVMPSMLLEVGTLPVTTVSLPPPCLALPGLALYSVTLLICVVYLFEPKSLAVASGLTSQPGKQGPSEAGLHCLSCCTTF